MKTSSRVTGHSGVASCKVSESILTVTIPGGGRKVSVSLYAGNVTARFINSVQMGAAEDPPANPKSRLSSNPTHTTHNKFEVYPANHPSFDVPVFPAAGVVNPIARTEAPVPRLITSSITLVTK